MEEIKNEQNVNEQTETQGSSSGVVSAEPGKRILATFIDMIVISIVSFVLNVVPILGSIAGLALYVAYILLRDGLPLEFLDNVSLGKKLMGLKVVDADTGETVNDLGRSAKRNWMLGVPCVNIIFCIVELVLLFTDADHRRWGDKLANTTVVSSK